MHTKKGFTLVELIVVITILAILGTLGYISLLGYNYAARDAVRISDVRSIQKVIELYKLENGNFPVVSNPIDVSYSGTVLWTQGSFGEQSFTQVRRISEVPLDPLTNSEFAYSVTKSTGEYEVGIIVEKGESVSYNSFGNQTYADNINPNFSYIGTRLAGNYNGKYLTYVDKSDTVNPKIYILGVPTILARSLENISLADIFTQKAFVYGLGNAPVTYSGTVDIGEWNFQPNSLFGDVTLIYTGSVQGLSNDSEKVKLVEDIQHYYAGTEIANSEKFSDIAGIDTVTQTGSAVSYVNALITGGIGGLNEDLVNISSLTSNLGNENINTDFYNFSSFCVLDENNRIMLRGKNSYSSNISTLIALKSDGSIIPFGYGLSGGSTNIVGTGFIDIIPSKNSFIAVKSDGSLAAGGNASDFANMPTYSGMKYFASTNTSYAAIKSDGSIIAWGGGEGATGEPSSTIKSFVRLFSNSIGFVAQKTDGSLVGWGNGATGVPFGTNYTNIVSSDEDFSAIASDGSLKVWGNITVSNLPSGNNFVKIIANKTAFAALTSDGYIKTYGSSYGATLPAALQTQSGFIDIIPGEWGFIGLKADGTIYPWGYTSRIAASGYPAGIPGFVKILGSHISYMGITQSGDIYSWGSASYGGGVTGSGFIDIAASYGGFTGLKSDGTVEYWGTSLDIPVPNSNIHFSRIYSNNDLFAGITPQGNVYTWGKSYPYTIDSNISGFIGITGGSNFSCKYTQ